MTTHPTITVRRSSGALGAEIDGIFVNGLFTTKIVGLKERESQALLSFLCEHAVSPEYTCRLRWQVGSVAFWDNRITQHVPINDYWPAERCMHRVVIAGDTPR